MTNQESQLKIPEEFLDCTEFDFIKEKLTEEEVEKFIFLIEYIRLKGENNE